MITAITVITAIIAILFTTVVIVKMIVVFIARIIVIIANAMGKVIAWTFSFVRNSCKSRLPSGGNLISW